MHQRIKVIGNLIKMTKILQLILLILFLAKSVKIRFLFKILLKAMLKYVQSLHLR